MSLINDALKRARQAQPKTPPSPVSGPPLRPVEAPRSRNFGRRGLLPIAGAAALVMALAIGWAVSRGGTGKKVAPVTAQMPRVAPPATATAPNPKPSNIQRPPVTTPGPVVRPAVRASNAPAIAKPTPAIAAPSPVPPPPPAKSPVPGAKSPPPAIAWPKLQGIFYRPDRPSVLLNNKTVLVGERSGDFLVVAIDRQSVTLVHAGVTNLLRMTE